MHKVYCRIFLSAFALAVFCIGNVQQNASAAPHTNSHTPNTASHQLPSTKSAPVIQENSNLPVFDLDKVQDEKPNNGQHWLHSHGFDWGKIIEGAIVGAAGGLGIALRGALKNATTADEKTRVYLTYGLLIGATLAGMVYFIFFVVGFQIFAGGCARYHAQGEG